MSLSLRDTLLGLARNFDEDAEQMRVKDEDLDEAGCYQDHDQEISDEMSKVYAECALRLRAALLVFGIEEREGIGA